MCVEDHLPPNNLFAPVGAIYVLIRPRGYQDPLAVLEQEMQKPDVIWQRPSGQAVNPESLVESACRHVRPEHLFIVLDQFEEFVIRQDAERQAQFAEFLASPFNGAIRFGGWLRPETVKSTG
jgi:hypothetical protein